MAETRFWLIRHALVEENARAMLYGTMDVPLCPETLVAQAPMYRGLAARLPRPAAWVVTPLSRTRLTAEALFRAGYPRQDLAVEPDLIEQDLGEWQGLPHAHLPARLSLPAHTFWPLGGEEVPPGGESMAGVIARVGVAMERLATQHAGGDVVIVSHGGAIRATVAHALGLSADTALHLSVQNISLTRLERERGSGLVGCVALEPRPVVPPVVGCQGARHATPMLTPLLAHWRERPQRTWSVVVTVFGDAIVPRGGSVWLGTLLELFGAMGIDGGAVRTAMSRLVADGWTERRRAGRNSFYRLAEKGHDTFAAAASRIYAASPPDWDGRFRLVLQPANRDALAAAGYGQASPGLWVSPGPAAPPDEPITLDAGIDAAGARLLAAQAWPLERLAASFARFNTAFAGLVGWQDAAPLDAMVARTLLIHEYRRIVLHAPDLPIAILPPGWPGATARTLCRTAYTTMLRASEDWLDHQGLPPAAGLATRFHSDVTDFS